MSQDFTIIISLISLGFFGGFTHCTGMCGPFVIAQVSNRLTKIPHEKFSNFEKLKNLALLPYHLGRITTYAMIGGFCALFRQSIEEFTSLKILSTLFLITTSLIFLNLFFEHRLFGFIKNLPQNLLFKSKAIKIYGFFQKKLYIKLDLISKLSQNPLGLRGYILGVFLGFIPCGLLYSAFLLSATITNPLLAMIAMILFGISTFPSLFLTASSGYIFYKFLNKEFKIISKIVILANSLMLFMMALKNL